MFGNKKLHVASALNEGPVPQRVRAKFQCASVTPEPSSIAYLFQAAIDDANQSWAKSTPSGSLTLQISHESKAAFEAGKFYFLDITEAE